MTIRLEVPPCRPATLTSSQLETVQRLWVLAGLPPVVGYATAVLALAVANDATLAEMVLSVDFDNAASTFGAVEALLCWRQRTFG
jgi:hypothetical protein